MNKFDTTFSRKSIRWLMQTVRIFLNSAEGKRAILWAICLVGLMLCINGMNVVNSYVLRNFMSSIERHDTAGFQWNAWRYVGVFAVSTIVAVYFRFSEERLGLLWRSWMTRWMTDSYINGKVYLHFQEESQLSNPDQRISEDVRTLTTTTLSFVLMILNSTMTIISFASVLWWISPTLFFVGVVYAIAGTSLTIFLGRPLVRLNYLQQDFEADFRSDLNRVRQAADGIALSGFEGRIQQKLEKRIDRIVENSIWIIAINRNLGFLTNGYNYMIQLIPALFVAPMFISNQVSFGVIGQSAMAFSTLVAALSLIVSQFQTISNYASVLTRLVEFSETAKTVEECRAKRGAECSTEAEHFTFRHLTLHSLDGDGELLVEDLNGEVEAGKNLLITSPKMAAKKALFLATAGLHVPGSGCIDRTPPEEAAFLPERAFFPAGFLRELLVSTRIKTHPGDEEIEQVLTHVGLEHLYSTPDGLNVRRNWHEALSLKEEQQLAIARVILLRPRFVFLDHPGNTLGESLEKRMLHLLSEKGMTCICFGSGSKASGFFQHWLELKQDGLWNWTELHPRLHSHAN